MFIGSRKILDAAWLRSWTGCILLLAVATPNAAFSADAASKNMTIDQRLTRIERAMANQNMVEMFMQLQNLQREMETLRGDIEVLNHEIENMKQRQKDLYLDLDNRIQTVETAARAAPGATTDLPSLAPAPLLTAPGTAGEGGVVEPSAESIGAPMREQESYQAALTLLKDGKYQEAIQQFQVLLITSPQGPYADNAQYWMGEAYYVMRDFKSAIVEFAKVIKNYPGSSKLSDSHLKIGFSYYELQEWAKARQTLETVVKEFPSTTAARLAERRLQQMKLENRT